MAHSDAPVIRIFHTGEDGHPYPWRFEITFRGVTHGYGGIPNKCATRREAAARAGWRAKWMREGTYGDHYGAL